MPEPFAELQPAIRPRPASPDIILDGTTTWDALSFGEELLWRTDCEWSAPVAFLECPRNMSLVARLRTPADAAPLDTGALRASVHEVMRRHAVLRSRFVPDDDRARRELTGDPDAAWPCTETDLRGLEAADRDARVAALLARQVDDPFDLRAGPLARGCLLRLGDREHLFAFTVHHIVFDAGSRRVLTRELNALYGDLSSGRTPDLPAPAASYADYVRWQRTRLDEATLERLMQAWRTRLDAPEGEPALPADLHAAAPPADPERAGRHRFALSTDLTYALRAMSRARRVTVATTLLALFTLLMHQATHAPGVAVGIPLIDRRRREFEQLIGLFTNVVVARVELRGALSFTDVVDRVRRALQEAYAEQDLPYGYFVHRLAADTGRPLTAPFRVAFNFINHVPAAGLALPGVETQELAVGHEPPSCTDVSLQVREEAEGLACTFLYQAHRFSAARIAALAAHFDRLIGQVIAAPDDARGLRQAMDRPPSGVDH